MRRYVSKAKLQKGLQTHDHSLLVVLSGPGWVLIWTAVPKRAVPSEKGLACWLIRSNPEAVLSLQELIERKVVMRCGNDCHGWTEEG